MPQQEKVTFFNSDEIDSEESDELPPEDYMKESELLLNLDISDDEQTTEHFQKQKLENQQKMTAKKFDRVQS